MEPTHLERDELEVELKIRGMPPVPTRYRIEILRERLLMEMRGEADVPRGYSKGDLALEVMGCFEKLKSIDYLMLEAADKNCLTTISVIPSRLLHVRSRLQRIITYDHRIVNQISVLDKKIAMYLDLIKLSLESKIILKEHFKSSDCVFKSIDKSDIFKKPSIVETSKDRPLTPIPNVLTLRPLGAISKNLGPITEDMGAVGGNLSEPEPQLDGGEDISARLNAMNLTEPSEHDSVANSDEIFWEKLMGIPSSSPNKVSVPGIQDKNNLKSNAGNTPFWNVPNDVNVLDNCGTQCDWWNVPKRNDIFRTADPKKPLASAFRNPGRNPTKYWNVPENEVRNEREFVQPRLQPRLQPQQQPRVIPVVQREVPQVAQNGPRYQRNRNPIQGWNLVFTGDGRGLNINNFLTQVHLMARADWVSDQDLFMSAIHLLSGPARNWYVAFERNYNSWPELAAALREQFLPHDSDISLMREVESKFQGVNEPFVLYISDMINLFDHMQVPLSDNRKLKIITRNMLPYLRESLALVEIENVNHLIILCRRLESVRKSITPMSSNYHQSRNQRVSEYQVDEVRNDTSRELNSNQNMTSFKCWNCLESGHIFENCSQPKMRVFCYLCGELGQLANSCQICKSSKNDQSRSSNPNYHARDGSRQ